MSAIRYSAAALLASALVAPGGTAHAPVGVGTVTHISDGDTIVVSTVAEPVRLLGIDAPEDPADCGGPDATHFATVTLEGREVTLTTDPTQASHDRYGRLLAYATLTDGTNYSVAAAEVGVVRAYTFEKPVQLAGEIAAAEQRAKSGGLGIWGPPCYAE